MFPPILQKPRTPYRFSVECDVKILDGPLRGVVVPCAAPYVAIKNAHHDAAWLNQVFAGGDFFRCCVTGHRKKPVTRATIRDI